MTIVDDPKLVEEVWESTTGGWVHVWTKDPSNDRNWICKKRAGGPGNPKVKITVEEREYNQSRVAWGNEHLDPFTNGMLRRVGDVPKEERLGFEHSDEDLTKMLTVKNDEAFSKLIRGIESEIVLRRMVPLAQKFATNARYEELKELVKERYWGNGSTDGGFYQEMSAEEGRYQSATTLR